MQYQSLVVAIGAFSKWPSTRHVFRKVSGRISLTLNGDCWKEKRKKQEMKEAALASKKQQQLLRKQAIAPASKIRERLVQMFRPKIPGTDVCFRRHHWIFMG
jgi:hypothetical protein